MAVLFEQYWWLFLIALLIGIGVAWRVFGGGGKTRVEQWDGAKWVPLTDWSADYTDVVWEVIKENSSKFKVE